MPVLELTQALSECLPTCPDNRRRVEYCDTIVKGLYIEIRQSSDGNGTYYLRYKNKENKTAHKKLGITTEITLAKARKLAKQLKADLMQGQFPFKRQAAVTVMSVAAFFDTRYLPHVKQHNRTWNNDQQMFNMKLRQTFGELPLNKVNKSDAQAFHAQLKEEGLQPATCDHYLKLLRRLLNVAVDWDVIAVNPLARVQLFNADNRLERYLTEEELQRLLHILYHDDNRMVCSILLFLLATGARLGEALNAKWSDIDTNRQWRIPQAHSKSKKPRYVPLNEVAISVLEKVGTAEEFEYVFVNINTGKPYTCIKKTWTRIRKAANLSHIRIHDLRHQYASMLVNQGRSLYEVQQLLGHSDPKVTERYAHLSQTTLHQAANSVSHRLTLP